MFGPMLWVNGETVSTKRALFWKKSRTYVQYIGQRVTDTGKSAGHLNSLRIVLGGIGVKDPVTAGLPRSPPPAPAPPPLDAYTHSPPPSFPASAAASAAPAAVDGGGAGRGWPRT